MIRYRRLSFAMCSLLLALPITRLCAADTVKLRAGAARVELTPTPASLPATGKFEHEKVYVRAIVLDNGVTRAAILGADSSDMYENVWADVAPKIAAELGSPVQNILMSVTHSHSAGSPMGPAATQPSTYLAGFAAAMLKAVQEAKSRLQPARVGFGSGAAYLNVNRDAIDPQTRLWSQAPNLQGVSDKTVSVLEFLRPDGEPIAVHVTYAMHPVNGYLLGFITADFPGAMSRYVEQAFDDKPVVIYAQNASGDQNPLYLRASTNGQASIVGAPMTGYQLVREKVESRFRDTNGSTRPIDAAVRERLERFIESEGQILGEEVIRVMTATSTTSDEARLWGAQKTVTCPGRRRLDAGREGAAGNYAGADPIPIRLSVLGVGNVALAGINAEAYTRIALRTKSQSPLANTVVVTLANGRANTGYIADDESYGHQTFQILGTRLKPGCAEAAIANGLTEMIEQYVR
jgi:neutral ceramidase